MTSIATTKNNTKLLVAAVKQGDINTVSQLIPLSDPKENSNQALRLAASKGYVDIVQLLIPVSDVRLNASALLNEAAYKGDINIAKCFTPFTTQKQNTSALQLAAEKGHEDVFNFLLPLSQPDDKKCIALREAALNRHTIIVQKLLPYFDKERDINCIEYAAVGGCVDIVKMIAPLSSPQMVKKSITKALIHYHPHLISDLLLFADRKKSYIKEMWVASYLGYFDAVQLLSPLVDLNKCSDKALQAAATFGHLNVVQFFLPTANPQANGSKSIRGAAINGHFDVVKTLLPLSNTEGVDRALYCAVIKNHTNIVDLLLAHSPSATQQQKCLETAASYGHLDLVQKFLPYSDPKAHKSKALLEAVDNNWLDIVKVLLPLSDGPLVLKSLENKHGYNSYSTFRTLVEEHLIVKQKERLIGQVEHTTAKHQPKRKM